MVRLETTPVLLPNYACDVCKLNVDKLQITRVLFLNFTAVIKSRRVERHFTNNLMNIKWELRNFS